MSDKYGLWAMGTCMCDVHSTQKLCLEGKSDLPQLAFFCDENRQLTELGYMTDQIIYSNIA